MKSVGTSGAADPDSFGRDPNPALFKTRDLAVERGSDPTINRTVIRFNPVFDQESEKSETIKTI